MSVCLSVKCKTKSSYTYIQGQDVFHATIVMYSTARMVTPYEDISGKKLRVKEMPVCSECCMAVWHVPVMHVSCFSGWRAGLCCTSQR